MLMILLSSLLINTSAFAQDPSAASMAAPPPANQPPKAKSGLSTQVYQQEKDEQTFTAKVKVVRQVQETWEAIFEGHPGFYTIGSSETQTMLVQAKKNNADITVRVDNDANHILSAQWAGPQKPLGK